MAHWAEVLESAVELALAFAPIATAAPLPARTDSAAESLSPRSQSAEQAWARQIDSMVEAFGDTMPFSYLAQACCGMPMLFAISACEESPRNSLNLTLKVLINFFTQKVIYPIDTYISFSVYYALNRTRAAQVRFEV